MTREGQQESWVNLYDSLVVKDAFLAWGRPSAPKMGHSM